MQNKQFYAKKEIPNEKLTFSKPNEQAFNAEINLLGSLLLDKTHLLDIETFLEPRDFYSKNNENIYRQIKEVSEKGDGLDPLILTDYMRHKGTLASAGGEQYIATLCAEVYSSAHAIEYARIVKNWSNKRDYERLTRESLYSLENNWIAEEAVDKQIKALEKISNKIHKERDGFDVDSLIRKIIDNVSSDKEHKTISTGIPVMDAFKVIKTSELTVIGARPSVGKTAMGLQIIANVCKQGYSVLFFSVEMSDLQCTVRMISNAGEIDSDLLDSYNIDKLSDSNMRILHKGSEMVSSYQLEINDNSNITMAEIKQQVRKTVMHNEKSGLNPLGLVVVDYIQEMKWSRSDFMSEENALGSYIRDFKQIAKQYELPVIVLAQLNRDIEKRSDNRPRLSDIRGSGSIEQAADIVLLIHREDFGKHKMPSEQKQVSVTDVICAKNRNGITGDFKLAYEPWIHKFQETWKTLEEKEARQ